MKLEKKMKRHNSLSNNNNVSMLVVLIVMGIMRECVATPAVQSSNTIIKVRVI